MGKWGNASARALYQKRDLSVFTIGVFGIIIDDKDRVLLCHRRDFDLWNLPGGGVETGESPWVLQGANRSFCY